MDNTSMNRTGLRPLLALIESRSAENSVCVIAIDGRSAAGKTTLAARLAQILGAGVVHMDDFFLPASLRTPARLSEPGGNVHYERFAAQVLPFLSLPEAFAYSVFDCSRMALSGERVVAASSFRIVEGAYSCHPMFGNYMNVRVFADIDPQAQLKRIVERNGEAAAMTFAARWIPMEEAYLTAFRIKENADMISSENA